MVDNLKLGELFVTLESEPFRVPGHVVNLWLFRDLLGENVLAVCVVSAKMNRQSPLAKGTPLLLLDKGGEYVHGYLNKDCGGTIRAQVGNRLVTFARNKVFWQHRGYIRPVPEAVSVRKQRYNDRKQRENSALIEDATDIGICLKTAKLLALDDFPKHGVKKVPNTTRAWIEARGRVSNIWVPNPDSCVSSAVTKLGGHGFCGTLDEMLQSTSGEFDVVYLDFCGFWSKNRDAVKRLFSQRAISHGKALVHITTCKREGAGVMEMVHKELTTWCREYNYGRCFRLDMEHSETMWKGSFVVGDWK